MRLEFHFRSPSGEARFFDTRLVPEFGADGRVESVVAITRDITGRHKAEERAKQRARQLQEANVRLEVQTRYDALTGVANRRHLFSYLDAEWRRARRHGHPISLIMVDIDHFKAYNDRYGHPVGDECLREVARVLQSQVSRAADLLARYGGEEFAVVLPETPLAPAGTLAERMRQAVESLRREHRASPIGPYVTISLGVAEGSPSREGSDRALIVRADRALYAAKANGRNRVAFALSD